MSIEVRTLDYGYTDGFRLSIYGLRLAGGKMTSIVGRNGAGKSTFLKCLAGVVPVPKRSIFLDDRDLAALGGRDRARRISYVPQEQVLALNYRVRDVVLMGRAAYIPAFSIPSQADLKAAEDAVRFVGLTGFENREFSRLSSGERRLALIARMVAQNADILLLDEPTTFLDPKHEIEVLDLCRRMAEDMGKTVVVTIHDIEMALRYSDEMVFMKDGRVAAAGPPSEIVCEDLLLRVYDIPMTIVPFDGKRLIVR
jgi:iron complex transport system ATP-binding protein